jgi:hypothetical protein
MKQVISLILCMTFGILTAVGVESASAPRPTLTQYVRDVELTVGKTTAIVIQVDNPSDGPMVLHLPVFTARQPWKSEINPLPDADKAPGVSEGLSLQVTSYMPVTDTRPFAASRMIIARDLSVPGKDSAFIRVDVPQEVFDVGRNRVRVTLFSGNNEVAKSNVVTIIGLPSEAMERFWQRHKRPATTQATK